jgi:ABC-type multidrug transport system ATPase subunit
MLIQLALWVSIVSQIELDYIKRVKGHIRRRLRLRTSEVTESTFLPPNHGIYVHELSYSSRGLDLVNRTYFKNVSFTIHKGEIMTIVSPQNAQKTALIQAIIHELAPTEGDVSICGVDMSGVCGEYPQGLIGYAPQELNLFG